MEVTVEFFRCFFHAVSDPPLNHFDKAAGNVVDKEAFRNLSAKLVVFQQVGFDQFIKALLEEAEEDIRAVGGQQVACMICVGRDVLEQVTENRIMTVYRFMCVTVAREVVVHDAFNDVIEEFAAHFFKQAFFGLKMSVECASSNVGQVNDVLNSDLCIRFFGKECAERFADSGPCSSLSAIHNLSLYFFKKHNKLRLPISNLKYQFKIKCTKKQGKHVKYDILPMLYISILLNFITLLI